jgi:hypothetical protein
MNKKKLGLVLGAAVLCLASCTKTVDQTFSIQDSNPSDGLTSYARNKKRARLLADQAWTNFFDEELPASYEYYPYKDNVQEMASVWHYGSMLSLYNKFYQLFPEDETIKHRLSVLFDGLEYYRENRSDYRVYAVNRSYKKGGVLPEPNSNVYDDNEWLAREFLNAYENTGDESYLTGAKELVTYILSGWDHSINSATGEEWGGIYWGPYYKSKHTCSNGPVISTLVRLSTITKDSTYLDWAKKVYDFSYKTFRMDNGVYGDMIGTTVDDEDKTIAHGSLDTTAYTYNTGVMISGGAYLYNVTKEQHYLDEALATAEASYTYFANTSLREGYCQFPVSTTLWFNLTLFQGYYDLLSIDKTATDTYFPNIQKSIDFAYNNYLVDNVLPTNWISGWIYGLEKDEYKDIMDVDSNAETYALLALINKGE